MTLNKADCTIQLAVHIYNANHIDLNSSVCKSKYIILIGSVYIDIKTTCDD